MKKMLFATVIALLTLSACNQHSHDAMKESSKIAVKVSDLSSDHDYFCGMGLSDDGIADTASYNGKLYGFCSKECKEGFMKEPDKYLSQQ